MVVTPGRAQKFALEKSAKNDGQIRKTTEASQLGVVTINLFSIVNF